MPLPNSANYYPQLQVNAGPDEYSQSVATGPQLWTELLIDTATTHSRLPELPSLLRIGGVAIRVIFAPETFESSVHDEGALEMRGALIADGGLLTVGQSVQTPHGSHYVSFVFRRPPDGRPYTPLKCDRDDEPILDFPTDPTEALQPGIYDRLSWIKTGHGVTHERLRTTNRAQKLVPHINITRL